MKQETYLTYKEVISLLESYELPTEEAIVEGFRCIWNYCETSLGWVASFEDCCPFCVATIIKNYGSLDDKLKFNSVTTLGKDYKIPLTNKDKALDNKRLRKGKRKNHSRYTLQKILKLLRESKVTVLRRGKKNLYEGLIGFWDIRERSCAGDTYVYVEGLRNEKSGGFLCITSNQEILEYVQKEVRRYNKINKSDLTVPEEFSDLKIIGGNYETEN